MQLQNRFVMVLSALVVYISALSALLWPGAQARGEPIEGKDLALIAITHPEAPGRDQCRASVGAGGLSTRCSWLPTPRRGRNASCEVRDEQDTSYVSLKAESAAA